MKLQVSFTVDVCPCEDEDLPDSRMIEDAVSEAVAYAIDHAEGEGHRHFLDEKISIIRDSSIIAQLLK